MRTFLRVAAIAYIAYLVIALLVISPALNYFPHKYLQDTYGRELRTGWILLNPFKLSLDVSDAQLDDKNGEPFVAFSEASVNLSIESLWRPGWVFDAVTLRDLFVEITRLTEDEYNFSDFLTSDTEEEPNDESGEMPRLTIHDVELHSEAIVLNDQARETAYSSRWTGLQISVTGISTVHEEGRPYIVDLEGDGGGTLHWEGDVSIPEGTSAGHMKVANLNLRKLWLFAQPWLQLELKDGRLAVEGDYEVSWNDALSYRIHNGHIGLSAIDIVPIAPEQLPDTALAFKALDINNIGLESTTQQVTIDTISLNNLNVATWLEDSTVSLQSLFAVNLPAGPPEEPVEEDTDETGWSVTLNKAQVLDSSLHWRSQLTDPAELDVQHIEAGIEHVTWPLSGDSKLSLGLTVNENTRIAADGTLALAEGTGNIAYSLDGLPLVWFNPNLPEALKATVTSGAVEVKGQVALQDYAPTTVALDGAIRDFSARREGAEIQLTGWDSVRFEGLTVDMDEHSLILEKLAIASYIGRIHIQEDGSINASNIWKEEVGEKADEIAEQLTQDKPWSFSLPTISITDSEIDFMDKSLPLQFRTVIGDLDGEVLNISSTSDESATVDIKGSVDGYAPVSLDGSFSAFTTPIALDLKLIFDGVDMARLSPYSGTYAGYKIDRGLLNLDLRYSLKDDHLQGNNSVRVDKLKLGEKISSDKAVDLPLKLALAILTDSNGVIDMQVPVSGDMNSPSFQLGGVISKAFMNILTKAITAPFTLLAGLVNTEEDLQRITFASGSVKLGDDDREKLSELTAALNQRPKLSLVITGRLNIPADRERLQKNALKVQLLEDGLSAQEIKTKGADWESAISERYSALATGSDDAVAPSIREQYQQVVHAITVSDKELSELAQQRAVAVKGFLLNDAGLAANRAVVGQVTLDAKANEFSGVELGIEN